MKGVPFSNKRYTKGVPFLKKWYIKGKGLDLGAEPTSTPAPGIATKALWFCVILSIVLMCGDGVGLGLRGCYFNIRLGRSRSARLITKSVYTGGSE